MYFTRALAAIQAVAVNTLKRIKGKHTSTHPIATWHMTDEQAAQRAARWGYEAKKVKGGELSTAAIGTQLILDLTEDDYDALYLVVKEEMPRITREMFPGILAQQVERGVLEITVTDQEIVMRLPDVPGAGVYRVERKRKLH